MSRDNKAMLYYHLSMALKDASRHSFCFVFMHVNQRPEQLLLLYLKCINYYCNCYYYCSAFGLRRGPTEPFCLDLLSTILVQAAKALKSLAFSQH